MVGRLVCTMVAAAVLSAHPIAQRSAPPAAPNVNPVGAQVADFQKRVQAYLALRDKADTGIPPLKKADDPQEIASREKALGDAIRAARAGALQGEIFSKAIAPIFRKVISDDYKRRTPQERKNLLDEHQEFEGFSPKVNQIYPTTVTLATFPPRLLEALPPLPDKLEYRFVRNTLILRDSMANLIIDYLSKVF